MDHGRLRFRSRVRVAGCLGRDGKFNLGSATARYGTGGATASIACYWERSIGDGVWFVLVPVRLRACLCSRLPRSLHSTGSDYRTRSAQTRFEVEVEVRVEVDGS